MKTIIFGRNKRLIFLILFLLNSFRFFAQDSEMIAKSAYLNAQDAYEKERYVECITYLNQAESALGKSNKKIEYLKVKAYFGNSDFSNAQKELNKYFELAKGNTSESDEKYQEMLKTIALIDQKKKEKEQEADTQRAAQIAAKQVAKENLNLQLTFAEANYKHSKNNAIGWSIAGAGLVTAGYFIFNSGYEEGKLYDKNIANNPRYEGDSGIGKQVIGGMAALLGGIAIICDIAIFLPAIPDARDKRDTLRRDAKYSMRFNPMLDHNYCLRPGLTLKVAF